MNLTSLFKRSVTARPSQRTCTIESPAILKFQQRSSICNPSPQRRIWLTSQPKTPMFLWFLLLQLSKVMLLLLSSLMTACQARLKSRITWPSSPLVSEASSCSPVILWQTRPQRFYQLRARWQIGLCRVMSAWCAGGHPARMCTALRVT